jgi:hypothetical protein
MTCPRDRLAVVFVVAVLLLTAPVATVTATPVPTHTSGAIDEPVPEPVAQTTPTNNSTAPHVNPENVSERGNLTAVRGWIARRIATTLVDCAQVATPTGNGTCTALAEGNAYRSLASQYGDVARVTDDARDDNVARVLNRTADDQLSFTRAAVRYRSTLAAYHEARRQGQVRRARVLARRVSQQGARVVSTGRRLSTDYGIIAGNGTMAIGEAREITAETTGNASATVDRIRNDEFSPPVLNVSANVTRVSFVDPVGIHGQLRARDGTPLAGRPIEIQTPGLTVRTETDANGAFTVTYRPTAARTGDATIVARYLPRNDSQYVGTEAQTNVSIWAASGTLQVNATPSIVAFGDELTVRGEFQVDGMGVAGIPVAVRAGDVRLTTTETNASGGFAVSRPVPAPIADGSTEVTVSLAERGGALTAESASVPIEIESTRPRLLVGTDRLDASTTRVYGRLSADDVPVPNATLRIRRNDESLATVRLSETGAFERNVSLPDLLANESTVLSVSYQPPRGNLEPIALRVEVRPVPRELPGPPDVTSLVRWLASLTRFDPLLLSVAALALLVVFLVASGAAYRSGGGVPFASLRRSVGATGRLIGLIDDADDSPADRTTTPSAGDPPGSSVTTGADADAESAFLNAARARIEGGRPDDAVIVAYGAVRRHLDARFDIDPALTHWELLAVYHDVLDGESRNALRQLTAAYESAAFSQDGSTVDTARTAYENAARLVGRTPPEADAAPVDD